MSVSYRASQDVLEVDLWRVIPNISENFAGICKRIPDPFLGDIKIERLTPQSLDSSDFPQQQSLSQINTLYTHIGLP